MYQSISIPAKVGVTPGVVNMSAPGSVFGVVTSAAEFRVQLDNQQTITMDSGRVFGNRGGERFRTLTFFNDSASAITVTFYAGDEDFRPNTPMEGDTVIPVTITSVPGDLTAVTPTEGIYVLTGAGIEAITADATLFFQSLRLYPAKAVVAGVLTANGNPISIGRSGTYLPDVRAAADTDYPVVYDVPLGQRMQLNQIRIKGTAGDGVFFSFV